MVFWCEPFFSLPMRADVDRKWRISKGTEHCPDIGLVLESHAPSDGLWIISKMTGSYDQLEARRIDGIINLIT